MEADYKLRDLAVKRGKKKEKEKVANAAWKSIMMDEDAWCSFFFPSIPSSEVGIADVEGEKKKEKEEQNAMEDRKTTFRVFSCSFCFLSLVCFSFFSNVVFFFFLNRLQN